MRENISSTVTIVSRLFLKVFTLDLVMGEKKQNQIYLILHFTKPKIQSQVVYILNLKILGSYVVLYSTYFH